MKKWLLIGIALIMVAGALVGCSCEKNSQPTKVIRIGNHNVKVVENLPENLKLLSIKLEEGDIFPFLVGTFKNVSDQTITFRAMFVLDGERIGSFPSIPVGGNPILKPGEEIGFKTEVDIVIGSPKEPKVLEVKLETFDILGTAPTNPVPPAPPEPTTTPEPSTPKPTIDGNVFVKAPSNPQTPAEVVAAFYLLINDGKYLDAARLIESGEVNKEQLAAGLKGILSWGPGEVKSIKIRFVHEYKVEGADRATVGITIYFKSGEEDDYSLSLIKEGGRWKIALNNF